MAIEFYNRNWRVPSSWNGTEDNNNKVSNYSMSFDGSSEYVDAGTPLNGLSKFTLSMWLFRTANQSIYDAVIAYQDSSSSYWKLFFNSSSDSTQLKFLVRPLVSMGDGGNTTSVTSNTGAFPQNQWTHVVVTSDGINRMKMYVNGVENMSSQLNRPDVLSQTSQLKIGRDQCCGGRFFEGQIDQVAIFDYSLTDGTGGTTNQIAELYGSSTTGVGNPMAITNGRKPVAYYPLGDYSAYNGTEYLVANSALSDYVFDFSGSNDYIDCGNDSTFNITAAISVSAWIKASSSGWIASFPFFATKGSNVSYMLFAKKVSSTSLLPRLRIGINGDPNMVEATTSINSTDWHHILGTFDGSTMKIYVNGQLDNSKSLSQSIPTGTDNFTIGGTSSGGTSALISNVAIFNTALPATGTESVASLYNYGTPPDISSYSGLQGFWKLDAGSTFDGSNWTVPDESSNSNNGTSSGMTAANLVQSNLNILSPYSRYALNFDGANDYIDIPYNTSLNLGTQATWNMWVKWDDITTIHCFASRWDSGQEAWYIQKPTAQNIEFNIKPLTGSYSYNLWPISGFSGVVDTWFNLCFVFDSSIATNSDKLKFYANGVLQTPSSTSGTFPDTIPATTAKMRLAEFSAGFTGRHFNGSISNPSIWNAALNSAQVTEIYNEGKPSNLNNHSAYSNLVSWWQLGENSSFNSNWTVLNEISTGPNGVSVNMAEDDLVSGVGQTASGVSSGMGGADNIVGDAPQNSTGNALSYQMGVDAKSTSVPT